MVRRLLVVALVACAKGQGEHDDARVIPPPPIDAAIDGNGCAMQPCTILPQCGCGGVTACDLDGNDSMGTACRNIVEPGRETSSCTALDRCDKGYVCLGNSIYATCKKYCNVDADCGTPRGRCAIDITNGGMLVSGIPPACSSNCNPLPTTQAPECPTNYKCGLFTASHEGQPVKVTDCSPAGAGTHGANCKQGSGGNDALCASGYLCASLDGGINFTCRRICNKTANAGCPGNAPNCVAFAPPHMVDIEYGVCN